MNFSDGVNRTYLVITPDGRVEPGPDLSPDEATRALVRQLGAQFSARIAELEREVERLRAFVRAVAEGDPVTFNSYEADVCFYCQQDTRDPHDINCLWMQARAILGLDV